MERVPQTTIYSFRRKNYEEKSLKKVTSAVLVAAMSMGLLAGCGGSKSSGEAKTDADGATVIKFGIHVANPKTGNGYLQYCSGI